MASRCTTSNARISPWTRTRSKNSSLHIVSNPPTNKVLVRCSFTRGLGGGEPGEGGNGTIGEGSEDVNAEPSALGSRTISGELCLEASSFGCTPFSADGMCPTSPGCSSGSDESSEIRLVPLCAVGLASAVDSAARSPAKQSPCPSAEFRVMFLLARSFPSHSHKCLKSTAERDRFGPSDSPSADTRFIPTPCPNSSLFFFPSLFPSNSQILPTGSNASDASARAWFGFAHGVRSRVWARIRRASVPPSTRPFGCSFFRGSSFTNPSHPSLQTPT
mmetsp:Transcript_441/g.1593  ORF Transcript_441/g.1593 Transcript_441/m.1593 type:complete len:275 (-) Transcript_441:47-871(-)